MRVTRTRWIAGQKNHLLGGVAEEQVYLVTYHEIPDEQWRKVMAIQRTEKQAEKRARVHNWDPPNEFSSVPNNLSENQVYFNMSQSLINVESDLK